MSIIGHTTIGKSVIIRPRITEKAGIGAAGKSPVYVFEIADKATKTTVRAEILKRYKVKAVKINIVNLPKKSLVVRGIKGTKTAVRKAMVFLKAGDKIDIV